MLPKFHKNCFCVLWILNNNLWNFGVIWSIFDRERIFWTENTLSKNVSLSPTLKATDPENEGGWIFKIQLFLGFQISSKSVDTWKARFRLSNYRNDNINEWVQSKNHYFVFQKIQTPLVWSVARFENDCFCASGLGESEKMAYAGCPGTVVHGVLEISLLRVG